MKSMAKLKFHYGLKLRMYPSDAQKNIIKANSDASRFVYNQMVANDKELYWLRQVKVPIALVLQRIEQLEARKKAKELSNHYLFLYDRRIDSLAKANAIQGYRKAWQMFHQVHTAGVPKFHRKGYTWKYQTNCQYPQQHQVFLSNGTVRFENCSFVNLPKLGRIRIKGSRKHLMQLLNREPQGIETRIGTVTITKDASGRFFLSMQLGSEVPFVLRAMPKQASVGIDLNTSDFLTQSDGYSVPNPRYYRTILKRLKKQQRALSRRQRRAKQEHRSLRDSKNYQKQRLLVAKIQAKVRDQRNDFLHKTSIALIKNHDLVVAENLQSKNMLKNHALAMSISDVGWRSFLGMLAYKAALYGTNFIKVSPKNTTQTCHDCGFVMGTNGTHKLQLKDREWDCPNCGQHHVRDWNAAQNILEKGIKKTTA